MLPKLILVRRWVSHAEMQECRSRPMQCRIFVCTMLCLLFAAYFLRRAQVRCFLYLKVLDNLEPLTGAGRHLMKLSRSEAHVSH